MKNTEYAFVRLQEVVDDMNQALINLAKVTNQQTLLNDVIESSEKSEQFKEFVEGTKKDIESKQKEYDALLAHRDLLKQLIEEYNNANEHDKELIAKTLLTIFVAFNVIQESALEDDTSLA